MPSFFLALVPFVAAVDGGRPAVFWTSSYDSNGVAPHELTVADLDGDGVPEVFVTHETSIDLTVFPLQNPGILGTPTTYAVGFGPRQVEFGDVDLDGDLDVLTANPSDWTVNVLANTAGALGTPTAYSISGGANDLAVADLDADGAVDVASVGLTTVSTRFGLGDGTFGAETTWPSGIQTLTGVDIGDVTGDGIADLVVSGDDMVDRARMATLAGIGDGTFGTSAVFQIGPDLNARAIEATDLDADGVDEVLVSYTLSLLSGEVLVMKRDGGLGLKPIQTLFALVSFPGTAVGAFDADGIPDVMVAGNRAYPGVGDGTFGANVSIEFEGDEFPLLADLDQDGDDDLLGIDGDFDGGFYGTDRIWRRLADGPGGLLDVTLPNPGFGYQDAVLVDIDADLDLDIVAIDESPGMVWVHAGDGAGGFAPPVATANQSMYGDHLVAEDFDGDGVLDVATMGGGSSSGTIGQLVILRGTGDGTLLFHAKHNTLSPIDLEVADLDGDGALDVAHVSWGDEDAKTRLGMGDGTFPTETAHPLVPGTDSPAGVAAADLNGDGFIDLFATDGLGPNGSVLLNTGTGSFGPPIAIPIGSNSRQVEAADLDLDGAADVVTDTSSFSPTDYKVALLWGDGAGDFDPPQIEQTYYSPTHITIADMDDDGFADIVAGSVLRNRGARTFDAWQVGAVGKATGDIDGDGDTDSFCPCRGSLPTVTLLHENLGGSGPSFCGLPGSVSVATGGKQDFALDAGSAFANDIHIVLGSLSGTWPGTPLGPLLIPLNQDAYTLLLLSNPAYLVGSPGLLDGFGGGGGAALLVPPLAPSAAGITAHHAFVTADPVTLAFGFASNAAKLDLVP